MRKFLILLILCIAVMASTSLSASAMMIQYDNKTVDYTGSIYELKVNGNKVETPMPPIIFNDRALVPVREVFEALGADVGYDTDKKEVSVAYGNVNLRLTIGRNTAYINNLEVSIPDNVTPKLIAKKNESAKTMVPVRFISETIGMNVDFDGENGIINITNSNYKPTPQPTNSAQIAESTPEPTNGNTPNPNKISSLGSVETYVDGQDTVMEISSSDGFSTYRSEVLTDPKRIIIYADNVAARSALVSCEINKGVIKYLRIAYEDKGSKIVLDTDEKIGEHELSINGNSLVIRIKPYAESKPGQKFEEIPSITPPPQVESSRLIVIDPGHGGSDPGASGSIDGVTYDEKDITLSVSLKVADILRNNGYNITMTRDDDSYPELHDRPAYANNVNASLFVSIHANSYDVSTANGTEIYYCKSNNGDSYGITSEQLANNILDSMMSEIDTRNRGVKTANYVVIKESEMPAVLVELGFLTNPSDMKKMADDNYQNAIAVGIANGIMQSMKMIR